MSFLILVMPSGDAQGAKLDVQIGSIPADVVIQIARSVSEFQNAAKHEIPETLTCIFFNLEKVP